MNHVGTLLTIVGITTFVGCQNAAVSQQDGSGKTPPVGKDPVAKGAENSGPSLQPAPAEPPPGAMAPISPVPTIRMEPVDMATAVGATPLQLIVSNAARPVGIEALNRLAASVKLVSWPDAKPVPMAVSQVVDTKGGDGEDVFSHIYFAPAEELKDRWYALVIDELPKGFDWEPYSRIARTSSGGQASRFRTGSDPRLSEVRTYAKEGNHLLEVLFSERVGGDPALVSAVGGKDVVCEAQPIAQVTPPAHGTGSAASPFDATYTELRLGCSGELDLGQALTLTISPGIKSTSGPSLNDGAQVQLKIGASEWLDYGASGKLYRIPASAP